VALRQNPLKHFNEGTSREPGENPTVRCCSKTHTRNPEPCTTPEPLSSKSGTCKTVTVTSWPWLSGKPLKLFQYVPSSPPSCFAHFTGPRRSLSLKLSDTRVYEPQIRAHSTRLARTWRESEHARRRSKTQTLNTEPCTTPEPLSSEYGTYKTVTATFWPWLSGKTP